MDCYCYLTPLQDFFLNEEKTPCERRFNNPFDEPIVPWRAEIFDCPISTKDKRRLHPFDSTAFPDVFVGYASSAEGSWTVDLFVVDAEGHRNCPASEINVKSFKVNAVEVRKQDSRRDTRRRPSSSSFTQRNTVCGRAASCE